MNNLINFLTDKTLSINCISRENYFLIRLQHIIIRNFLKGLILLIIVTLSFSLKAKISETNGEHNNEEHSSDQIKQTTKPERYILISKINQYIRHHYYKPKAAGLIIGFHQWLDPKTQEMLLTILEQEGLTKTKNINESWSSHNNDETTEFYWKLWLLEWPELRYAAKAKEICQNLPEIPQLKHCEPDGQSLIGSNTSDKIVLPEEEAGAMSVCQSLVLRDVPEVKEACELYIQSHNIVLNPKKVCQTPDCEPDETQMEGIDAEQLLQLYTQ